MKRLITAAVATALFLMAPLLFSCTSPSATTTTTPTTTNTPTVTITSPGNTVFQIGDVPVSVTVTGFNVVDKQGQPNVAGEGHLHFYLDLAAPTTPGQPAIPLSGAWAHVSGTNYTFHNVTGGQHTISAELVNNDHTPLVPPVVATVNFQVIPEIGPAHIVIATPIDGATLAAGNIAITVQVSNFNVVDKQGLPAVAGEGHVHFYLDVIPPSTPGQPAIPASGVWAHVSGTTYTFTNVAAGTHTIYVQLVNNDHTPLTPNVISSVTITTKTVQ